MDLLDIDKDYNMLSLRDLVAARDLYHLHLMDKQHVVATAVGRYLIRSDEEWPHKKGQAAEIATAVAKKTKRQPRTLDKCEVRPYSWPCVLVFVDTWVDIEDVASGKVDASKMVPSALNMPDGTRVPVCVVYAPPVEAPEFEPVSPSFPQQFIGGGYPIVADVQNEEHVASVGCMVTDGHDVYALTNRHVTGAEGETLYSVIGGERVEIGTASGKQLTRLKFNEVYPEWPGRDVYLNLDVGLIKVTDLTRWTAQVFGVGQMGKLADLSVDNISLRLVDAPVRAFGAASGPLSGRILGLFYRYKSVGGMEYVSDFLIAPREEHDILPTRPGDSGTVWLLEATDAEGPRPIAVQWGGHAFVGPDGAGVSPYALATCLSTVCEKLEVDVVRDWNIGILDYWGAVGHYTIATMAIDRIDAKKYPKLAALMRANMASITFAAGSITSTSVAGLSTHAFVPLADVPDLVWKIRGGTYQRHDENPNHFADMDAPRAGGTLLDLCKKDLAKNVDTAVWKQYYDDVKDGSRGCLPFRVQQFYEDMVADLKKAKPDFKRFFCSAAIVSHYVGDACQPLHISSWFNGDPTHKVPNPNAGKKGQPAEIARGAGVHAAYEDDMVNYHIGDITKFLQADKKALPKAFKGGKGAAQATVELILETFHAIAPKDIVEAYVTIQQGKPTAKDAADALWATFGTDTKTVIAAGTRMLAAIWQSAWAEGGGEGNAPAKPTVYKEPELEKVYQPAGFVPSKTLNHICEEIAC